MLSKEETTLRSRKIILRPFQFDDLCAFIESCHDGGPYTKKSPPITKQRAQEYIKSRIAQSKEGNNRTNYCFAIIVDGACIGALSLSDVKSGHKAEVAGVWLRHKYWGQGLGTKSVVLLTRFGFRKLELRRIYAYIDIKNIASIRTFEKAGYKREGLLRKEMRKQNGKFADHFIYAKIR